MLFTRYAKSAASEGSQTSTRNSLRRRVACNKTVSERIDEYLQRLMTRRQRPGVEVAPCSDQSEWLPVLIHVNPLGARLLDVILDDQRPVARRYVLQMLEGVHSR